MDNSRYKFRAWSESEGGNRKYLREWRSNQMSQSADILKHLRKGETLTALQALDYYGCARLAARINELRDKGYMIESKPIVTRKGKRISRYRLVP